MAAAKGRWTKTSGNVPADGSGSPSVVVIVPGTSGAGGAGEDGWGVNQVSVGLAVDLDPVHLVDAMTRAFMEHTRAAIMAGQRPDGGGEQKALSRRALSDPDRDSPHRAFNTGELADGIRRTAIKSDGAVATSKVLPPTSRTAYVAAERKRGVLLLSGKGAAGEVAARAAEECAAEMAAGRRVVGTPAEVEAKDAVP